MPDGLITKKENCLRKIHKMTMEFNFTGEDSDDADRYAAFIAEREKLFDELKDLDIEIKKTIPFGGAPNMAESEVKKVIHETINRNEWLETKAKELTDRLKDGIKDINNTRNLNMYYNYNYDNANKNSGMLIDEKK